MRDADHRFAACRRGIVSKCSKTCSGNLSFEIGTALLRVAGRTYNLYAKASVPHRIRNVLDNPVFVQRYTIDKSQSSDAGVQYAPQSC
jgi:hypothetical protein